MYSNNISHVEQHTKSLRHSASPKSLHLRKRDGHLSRPLTDRDYDLDSADYQFNSMNRTSPKPAPLPLRLGLWRLLLLLFSA